MTLILLVIIIAGFVFYNSNSSSQSKTTNQNNINSAADSKSNIPSGISLADLAKHNKESDCWVAYSGKVYDITSFLPMHKGGKEKLIPLCGTSTEFENAFGKAHGTTKVAMLKVIGTSKGDLSN